LLGQQSLASTPGTNGEEGTGMGIKICQQLLAQNQSRLQVISEEEVGSQFYFRLPLSS
jgi:signal transduction histidine kinase